MRILFEQKQEINFSLIYEKKVQENELPQGMKRIRNQTKKEVPEKKKPITQINNEQNTQSRNRHKNPGRKPWQWRATEARPKKSIISNKITAHRTKDWRKNHNKTSWKKSLRDIRQYILERWSYLQEDSWQGLNSERKVWGLTRTHEDITFYLKRSLLMCMEHLAK